MPERLTLADFYFILREALDENAHGRAVPADLAMFLADQASAVVRELAELRDRRRLSTRELVARITRLERQLHDREPGERAAIIRQRLGLTRSTFYRLRRVSVPDGTQI